MFGQVCFGSVLKDCHFTIPKRLCVPAVVILTLFLVFFFYGPGFYESKSKFVVSPHQRDDGAQVPSSSNSSIDTVSKLALPPEDIILNNVLKTVHGQLESLQSIKAEDCENISTIECGHTGACGFGCQVHCRLPCLMLSYALNMPLIHDEMSKNWPYAEHLSDMFEPLGSRCVPGPNTITIQWNGRPHLPRIYKKHCKGNASACDVKLENPLLEGIPAPAALAELVESVNPDPWFWWIGLYVKYGLRLRPELREKIEKDKAKIGFTKATKSRGKFIVGMHVRRTDKVQESTSTVHALAEYFGVAKQVFANQTALEENETGKYVFIASDDHLVLGQARGKYKLPEWNVLGFPSNRTMKNMKERKDGMYSIVRDVLVLAECDHVVCAYSSNLCRMVLALLSVRFGAEDATRRVTSLDGSYDDYIHAARPIPLRVLKF